jgi:hypothetical protein
MYPPSSWIFGLSLFIAHSLRPLVNAANKHSAELVRRSHSLSLLRNGQVLEDAEHLIAAWNEHQAKRMPMLFSPTIGCCNKAERHPLPTLRDADDRRADDLVLRSVPRRSRRRRSAASGGNRHATRSLRIPSA